jgi:hypothetical protein
MKVLVIGGMHGNEPLGIELVKRLQNEPVENVDAVIANSEALAASARFTGQDLNRSFPGSAAAEEYEPRRANELTELCKQYDVVLDFHNTYCPDNDCGFVGETATRTLSNTASYLGLKRVIVADYDCINKYAPNCLSVEISMDSEENNVTTWREKVRALGALEITPSVNDITTYRFVYRMTLEDRDDLNLTEQNLQAFQPISPKLAAMMGISGEAYPIFIGDTFTPYNYGGLLQKINK